MQSELSFDCSAELTSALPIGYPLTCGNSVRAGDRIFPSDRPATVMHDHASIQCLTPPELAQLRRAFERYGTGDGFWLTYTDILDAATNRLGCDRNIVNEEMRDAFRKWAKEDPQFL